MTLVTLVLIALSLLTIACELDTSTEPAAPESGTGVEVVRVVDGDTIIVDLDGEEERVRYIGIDAPESVQPDRPVECFGPEASEANADLVEGKRVHLVRDVTDRDRFGRLLRYVFVGGGPEDGTFVNRELVRNGYAESVAYAPDTSRQGDLDQTERSAMESGRGMWSACRGR